MHNTSTGGNARFVTNAGGFFDISALNSGGMTAGSIEGAGTYSLGGKALTVGGNDLSTEVSGTIEDGGDDGGTGGSLIKVGTGTLTLSGANTYTGSTTVSGGTLQAGSATGLSSNSAFTVNSVLDLNGFSNTIGSLAGTGIVTNNGETAAILTTGFDSTSTTFSGVLKDGPTASFDLDKIETGTLTLTGANTYTGGTTINGGTLQIANGLLTGSIVGNVTDNAALVFDRSDTVTFGGIISGTGSLTQLGDSPLILTGENTYTGGTTISAGKGLQIGNGGISGSIVGNVIDDGFLTFDRAGVITFAGNVSGTGILRQEGAGTLTLTGLNSQMGGTALLGGTLSVDKDTELGAVGAGLILQGGELLTTTNGFQTARAVDVRQGKSNNTLAAATGTTATYTGVFSDLGVLTVGDGTKDGTVVLASGANTYSGGTTVFRGATLSIDTDAELGDPSGAITLTGGELLTTQDGFSSARLVTLKPSGGTNTLAAATGTTATYAGILSGTGGLTVGDFVDKGTVVLTNGANAYSGGTTVLGGGTLSVDTDAELGNASGGIILKSGGELLTTANFTSARSVSLNPVSVAVGIVAPLAPVSPNILAAAANTTATYTGVVFGTGGD